MTHGRGTDYQDIIFDRLGQFQGLLVESNVASELTAGGIDLHYWRSEYNAEVDLLLVNAEGVIPLEAKSAGNRQSKSLGIYRRSFNPPDAVRASSKIFRFTNGIKSVPLYAVFCLASRSSGVRGGIIIAEAFTGQGFSITRIDVSPTRQTSSMPTKPACSSSLSWFARQSGVS